MKYTSFLLLVGLPMILAGQSPDFFAIDTKNTHLSNQNLQMSCNNYAGTFRIGFAAPTNKSNATTNRKHIYLCKNDSVSIIHNGDFRLSGDPKPLTPAGIGYIMYKCGPKGPTGPALSNILTDLCLLTQASAGGTFTSKTEGLWMVKEKINGDLTFFNQGQLQASFNSGGTVHYWFAPITIDDFSGKKYETATGSTVAGACVNVNITEAIQVTYLNPIIIEKVTKNCLINNCVNRIVVKGGLPEYNNSSYNISIINKNNANIKGKIISTNLYKRNDTLEIFVPVPGEYIITATDEYSCDGNITLDFTTCPSTTFNLPKQNVKFGDEICFPVTASKVKDAVSLTLGVTWDNTVLKFKSINTNNTKLTSIGTSDIRYNPISNDIKISYFKSGGAPFSLNDGDLLLNVCLEVIGSDGRTSPLTFINEGTAPSPLEDDCGKPMGFQYSNGQLNVTDDILFVDIDDTILSCQNLNKNRALNVTVTGGTAPWKITWLNKNNSSTEFTNINSLDGKKTISGLQPGQYLLTITDSAPVQNKKIIDYEITYPGFRVQLDIEKYIICNNDSTGALKARLFINSKEKTDLTNYDFLWSNNPNLKDNFQQKLPFGNYHVTVSDKRINCLTTTEISLTNPSKIFIDLKSLQKATCSGVADGEAVITVSGGIKFATGYTLKWADQASSQGTTFQKTNLLPGNYPFSVVDARGCQKLIQVIIDSTKLDFEIKPLKMSCPNSCDGALLIQTNSSFNMPIFILNERPIENEKIRKNGDFYEVISLCPGRYEITMHIYIQEVDKQCSIQKNFQIEKFEISNPNPFEVKLPKDTILCPGDTLNLSLPLNKPGIEYYWQDSTKGNTLVITEPGIYLVNTTLLGCTLKDSIDVRYRSPISFDLGKDTVLCPGTIFTIKTGLYGTYSYRWNTGLISQNITIDKAGIYSIEVNSSGCRYMDTIKVDFQTKACFLTANQDLTNDIINISIWPNPVENTDVFLDLTAKNIGLLGIEIYNQSGGKMLEKRYQLIDQKNLIPLIESRNLQAGIYIIIINYMGKYITKQLVVN